VSRTSDDDEADWRCWRASTADDWWTSSARYNETVQCGRPALTGYTPAPSASAAVWGMAWWGCGIHQPSSRIHHRLHLLAQIRRDSSQRYITIVQLLQDERWHR